MKEANRGQIVVIKSPKVGKLEGVIEAVTSDRMKIFYQDLYREQAMKLSVGDEILADIHSEYGIKNMRSMIINSPREDKELVIENCPSIKVKQKREHVRVSSDFAFFYKKENEGETIYNANCVDISAGGMKFETNDANLKIGDKIYIKLLGQRFEKSIEMQAEILHKDNETFISKYIKISEYDRDRIVRYCFKILTEARKR